MSKYSPNEFLYARPVAHLLLNDAGFRQWFLAETKLADAAATAKPLIEEQVRQRTTANAKKWFWFNYFCPKDRLCECRGEKGIESDIVLVLESADGMRFAVHVEVKPPNCGFLPGQAEAYPRRANCWVSDATRPTTVPAHDAAITALVCGDELLSDTRVHEFAKHILHRDIAKWISPYPDLTDVRLG
jgi:hypothetical protein